MKYLFLLIILLGCENEQQKVIAAHHNKDTTLKTPIKYDSTFVDIHDPYETGKDTIRLNKVIAKILKFPEVEYIRKQIDKSSKGTRGVAFFVHDNFDGDTSYYLFEVGDNSHRDRYVNVYNFLLEKKTGEIKVSNALSDSLLSLKDWRKRNKEL